MIAFNSRVVARADAPHDWDDVLAPRWFDKVLIRDPMASGTMRAIWGLDHRAEPPDHRRHRGRHGVAPPAGRARPRPTRSIRPSSTPELARAEGLVTLWDLPDILISRSKGMPFDYVFPRSGTVVIDDAIGLVRGSRHADAARGVHRLRRKHGGRSSWPREKVFRLPARNDLPMSRIPAWVAEVEREMVVADVDWELLARDGAAWMGYWDRHVRGTAGAAWP